ncbi:MAG TPA: arginase family protein [Thermoleophilaceae bacterium]|nr:arginase family protein [Thermoleophilaceae bacterium]
MERALRVAASLIAMRCRTADRFPGALDGVGALAPLVGEALGVEPRAIGDGAEVRETRFEDDLRESRGCLLEAGGQIDDALTGENTPLMLAGDCSVSLTTVPAALRNRPDARVLWLDAHGDYNTPETTGSGYLGGMCLAGACGVWDAGLGATVAPDRVVLAGIRDLDAGERELLEGGPATVIGASTVETLVAVKNALDGAPVFIHLDLDVIDPEHFPAAVPAPGGLHPDRLYDLLDSVLEDCELVGVEVTAIELPESGEERAAATTTAMHVLEPLLDHLAADQ